MNQRSTTEGEKIAFLNGLKQYLEDKGKILVPYPKLAGKVIDLHELYNKVTALGGYQKVTEKELWEDFLKEYKFQTASTTLSYGLKTIYRKFLIAYERVHYFGDDEGSKKPRYDVSIRMSRRPTIISEADRKQYGLNLTRFADGRFSPDSRNYERLAFSLTSCLPNEVDFAINACTLLSGESRHVLRLSRCPQVLEALLLHAGIASEDYNSFGGIVEEWNRKTGHDFSKFWQDTVPNKNILDFALIKRNCASLCQHQSIQLSHLEENSNSHVLHNLTEEDDHNQQHCNDSNISKLCSSKESSRFHKNSDDKVNSNSCKWSSLFQSKRASGVQDYEGQRVLQISLVLLNLSFEEFNVLILARSKPLLRFIFLCIHSTYSSLRQTGLDILGNISPRMDLLELGISILECTYKTLQQCVLSANKFDQIRGFEILGNLCCCASNKECLNLTISDEVYSHALHLLTLNDIELLVAALDALYGMSKLGEESCTRIMLISGSIDILIGLITINIRTFDQNQLSKIRVARHILPNASAPPSVARAVPQQNHNPGATSLVHPPPQPASACHPHPPIPPRMQTQPAVQLQFHQQQFPAHGMPPQMSAQPSPMLQHQQHNPPIHQTPNPPRSPLPPQQLKKHHPPPERLNAKPSSLLPQHKQQPTQQSSDASTSGNRKVETHQSKPQPPSQPRPMTSQNSSVKTVTSQVALHPSDVVPVYTHTEHQFVPPVYHYIPAPPSDIVLDKSPQSFAQLWVWATFESCQNEEGSTPRVEVFAEYAAAASRYGMCGAKQVLPASEFGRCLQRVFPHTASRLFKDKKGQPLYHITGIRKRPTAFPVPGHHPQTSTTHNGAKPLRNQVTSASHSKDLKMPSGPVRSAGAVAESTPASNSPVHTSPSHSENTLSVTTSLVTTSNLCNNDVTNASVRTTAEVKKTDFPASVSASPVPSEKDQIKPNSIPEPQNSTFTNGSQRAENDSVENSCERNLQTERMSNHISERNSKPVADVTQCALHNNSKSSTHETMEGEPKAGHLAEKNHCDDHGTIQLNNGEINCDVSEKDKNISLKSENDLSFAVTKHSSASNSNEAVMCNGEFPLCDEEVNKKLLTKDLNTKHIDSTKKIKMNGLPEECKETVFNANSTAQENCVAHWTFNEIKLPPQKIVHRTPVSVHHNSNSPQILSPQMNPIDPDQLQKHYKSQSQKSVDPTSQIKFESNVNVTSGETVPASSGNTEVPDIPETASSSSDNRSVSLKRNHSAVVCTSEAPPPAKVQKTVEQPHLPPSIKQPLTPPAPTTNYSNAIHPPLPQIHSPAANSTSSSTFRHPAAPASHPSVSHHVTVEDHTPPTPQVHAQRKAPVVDLMAPNASLLVLYRNSGKCSFEDATDEKEDPISKSVRLTAVLILINIGNYSDEGRSKLQRHEPLLAYLSMSGMDCSPMLAKLLSQLDR